MSRKKFTCNPELPYHITARCINREWFSIDMPIVWKIMTKHLHFIHLAYNVRIVAFVLMSNHFHLIIRAPEGNLSEAMQFFMSQTGRDLRENSHRINRCFGGRFHRSLLTSHHYFNHAYKYLYQNPVVAGIAKLPEDYPFSTLPGLLGRAKLDVPICDDISWESLDSRLATLKWLGREPDPHDWKKIKKALKKSEFAIAREGRDPDKLENDAL